MNKISTLKIIDKKLLKLYNKCNIISLLCCITSFLFTYYFLKTYNQNILIIGLLLFEAGTAIKIGSFISAVIIQNYGLSN